MKVSTLLLVFFASANFTIAQMFSPPASALPDGELNQTYSEQIINYTVPTTTTVPGDFVAQAIAIAFPAAAPAAGLLGLESQTFDFNVTRTTLIMDGLPAGINGICDATPCTYIAGSSGFITVSGTPTEAGNFDVDILTLTEGEADISSLGGGFLDLFGIPTSFALPAPVPTDLDELGYSLTVNNTSSIEEVNKKYQLTAHPNPTSGRTTTISFYAETIETIQFNIYSLTGQLVKSELIKPSFGRNQIELDIASLRAGSYLLQTLINSEIGLIRIDKR